jgi:hypothetical protein
MNLPPTSSLKPQTREALAYRLESSGFLQAQGSSVSSLKSRRGVTLLKRSEPQTSSIPDARNFLKPTET